MSDDHPSSSDDTAPLTASDGASWLPPREQQPPHQWTPSGPRTYARTPTTPCRPVGPTRRPARPSRTASQPASRRPARVGVPGWLWPVVSVLALIVGVIGGVVGGAAYENWHTSSREGQVGGGLADAGTVSQAPLPAGNHSVASVAQQLLPSTIQVLAQYQGKKDGATGSGFVLDRSGHYITNNHVVADAVSHDGPIEIVDQNGDTLPRHGRRAQPDLRPRGALREGRPAAAAGEPRHRRGAPRRRPGRRVRLAARAQLDGHLRHRQRAEPTGHHERHRVGRVVLHQRRADRCRDQPRQLRRPVGRPVRPRGRGQLRDRDDRQQRVGARRATSGSASRSRSTRSRSPPTRSCAPGRARYPVIGASVDTGDATDTGAKILGVTSGSPAASAGLKKGDVVTEVEGEKVADGIALIVAIRAHQPGDTVRFTVRARRQRRCSCGSRSARRSAERVGGVERPSTVADGEDKTSRREAESARRQRAAEIQRAHQRRERRRIVVGGGRRRRSSSSASASRSSPNLHHAELRRRPTNQIVPAAVTGPADRRSRRRQRVKNPTDITGRAGLEHRRLPRARAPRAAAPWRTTTSPGPVHVRRDAAGRRPPQRRSG